MTKKLPEISIFFDLETTDLEPIGQILNFSFIAVDRDWQIVDEISDRITVSRLQLPRGAAMVANRVNILTHQQEATLGEREAMECIHDFISRIIERSAGSGVALIGYNSANFDLLHLRTAMIRNGINPYFRLDQRDLLFVVQKLSLCDSRFQILSEKYATDMQCKVSARLEFIARMLGVLDGAQLHESRADVVITIEVARKLNEDFGIDVRSWDPYEARHLHDQPGGTVLNLARLGRSPKWRRYVLHSANYRNALWLNIDRFLESDRSYAEAKRSISWVGLNTHGLIVADDCTVKLDWEEQTIVQEALKHLEKVTLDNFFEESTCDIEQFIYRISPGSIASMSDHFSSPRSPKDWSDDMKTLHRRYRMREYRAGSGADEALNAALAEYAMYRYGGALQLDKSTPSKPYGRGWHPTFNDLVAEIAGLYATAVERGDLETACILEGLKTFYRESELYAVAGPALAQTHLTADLVKEEEAHQANEQS